MVNIDIQIKEQAKSREHTVVALGWIQYQSTPVDKSGDPGNTMRVLGMLVVKDRDRAGEMSDSRQS